VPAAATVTVRTDRPVGQVQVLAALALGYVPAAIAPCELGVAVTLVDPPEVALDDFRRRLRARGHRVLTTRRTQRVAEPA